MAENRELALVLKLVADQFQSEMKKSGGVLGEFSKLIRDWKVQVAAVGGALFAIAKSAANFGEEALKTSQRLGLTVEKTTALQYAAGLADVPVQTLEKSLQTLAQRAVEASTGTGEGAKLFTALGLSATDAAGKVKPLDQLFFELQDRLKGVGNQAEFVDAGVTAFGKGFRDLVPLLRQGSEATKAAMEEGKRFGVVLSQDQAQAASRFNDELKRLTAQANGLKLSIGNDLIPTMTQLIELFRTLTSNELAKFFFRGLAEQVVLFSNLVKQAAANVEFLFGKLSFDELKTKLKGLEAEASAKLLLLENPAAAEFVNGPQSALPSPGGLPSGGGLTRADAGKEQERLAKAWNEIWQTGIRGQEIEAKLFGEVMQQWSDRAAFFENHEQRVAEGVQALREYAEAEFRRDEEMIAHGQEIQNRRGTMIMESTKLEVEIQQRALAEQAAANRTFFDEWKLGMDKYVRDTKTGLGLGADMARRTAQAMEQSFRQFFFDVWDRKIQSMADVLETFADFAKQVLGTVFSQLATRAVLTSFGFGGGIPAFASGGAVFGPTLALVGERASRSDPEYIGHASQLGLSGAGGVNIQINNYSRSDIQAQDGGRGPDGNRLVYIAVRDAARAAFGNGDMDKTMHQRFGMSPSPGRR